jgi:hypothetical protein
MEKLERVREGDGAASPPDGGAGVLPAPALRLTSRQRLRLMNVNASRNSTGFRHHLYNVPLLHDARCPMPDDAPPPRLCR